MTKKQPYFIIGNAFGIIKRRILKAVRGKVNQNIQGLALPILLCVLLIRPPKNTYVTSSKIFEIIISVPIGKGGERCDFYLKKV